ncbi:MAG: T9SS type A sorting domain-containing protein [Bacteroidota bacterium]
MESKQGSLKQTTSLKNRQKLIFRILISAVITAGIVGIVKVYKINASLDIHNTPVCAGGSGAYTFDWSAVSWTDGSLSNSYSNVDGSGVEFSFTYTGNTSKFGSIGSGATPNIQDFFPSETVDALSQYITSGFSGSEKIVLAIDISPAIPANVAFDIYHVNGSSYSGDKLTIYAVPEAGGANIIPYFTDNGSPSWEDEGNGVVDATGGSTDGNNAYVGVHFAEATYINQIVIEWTECDICGGGVHGIGMGNIDFCMSVVDTDGDGILDVADIDDDNDGITDIEEVCGIQTGTPTGKINIDVQLDGYANEVSWTLKNSAGTTVLSSSAYSSGDNNTLDKDSLVSAPADTYTFNILDSYGDGVCCSSSGYYQLKLDGNIIIGPVNGNFGSSATHTLTISGREMNCVSADPSLDSDGDGTVNYADSDFCSLNAQGVCSSLDKDSDGIPDFLDLDADNDGIPDLVEAGGADDDGDGRGDYSTDTDNDGLLDGFETAEGSTTILLDTDGDGTNNSDGDFDQDNLPNWLDLDADGDGITDVIEAGGTDNDANGIIDNASTDTDIDGFADGVDGDVGNDGTAENTVNALIVSSSDADNNGSPDSGYPSGDTDLDGNPNFLDIDADNDGIVDNTEAQATSSYQAPANSDTDSDGIDNTYDNSTSFGGNGIDPVNTDTDGGADYLDTDADGDKQLDVVEGHDTDGDNNADASSPANTGQATGVDSDGDGLDDGFDNNTASTDATNGGLSPSSHPIYDGGSDRDWRAQVFLPVEWVGFDAVWQGNEGLLSWETALEINASHFQIQRMIENTGTFEALGKVDAEGNSTTIQSYEFRDRDLSGLKNGTKIFYRLKQIDIDGKFEFSKVVELLSQGQSMSLRIYPNPAKDKLTLSIQYGDGNKLVKILSMNGRLMFQKEMSSSERNLNLDVSDWAKAIYTVQVEAEDQITHKRLVIK